MKLISSEALTTVKSKNVAKKRTDYLEMTKRIFIGEENFEELISSRSVYIDKTWQIRNFFNEEPSGPSAAKVMLFTRPRRFGKTLTMSMLKCFF